MLSARPRDSSQATARLTERTTATDDPAPSLQPRYRTFGTTTGRSASVSGDGTHVPTGHSRLGHSLSPPLSGSFRTRLLTFRTRAADQAHAASAPDTAWPVNGYPPGSSQDAHHRPGSDVI